MDLDLGPALVMADRAADDRSPAVQHIDISFPSLDGTALKARHWSHPDPRGLLLISHGLGEHGGSYRRLAERLIATIPIDIVAFDYRGSGRSAGRRGVLRNYDDLTLDLEAANRWAAAERPGLLRFLLGHSNGGLVALKTVLERDLGLAGLIVSNPSLRLSAKVPTWKKLAAELLARLAPGVTLETGLTNDQLTRDPAVMDEIEADPLRHCRISPPLYFGMKAAGPLILGRAGQIRLPILLILGGSDPVVDPAAGLAFFAALGASDKTLQVYESMRHEPFNEIGRDRVMADLAGWISSRLGP